MKTRPVLLYALIVGLLAACQSANPTLRVAMGNEFTLARDQSAVIRGTNLTVTFSSVLSDNRCPSEIECAASGPVAIALSVQREGDDIPVGITLETFTDQEGRVPSDEFEGVEDSARVDGYLIRVVGVLPYPRNLSGIKASDYQATLVVTQE